MALCLCAIAIPPGYMLAEASVRAPRKGETFLAGFEPKILNVIVADRDYPEDACYPIVVKGDLRSVRRSMVTRISEAIECESTDEFLDVLPIAAEAAVDL